MQSPCDEEHSPDVEPMEFDRWSSWSLTGAKPEEVSGGVSRSLYHVPCRLALHNTLRVGSYKSTS